MAQCRRAGCAFRHRDCPREHRFCCNACRLGQHWHTNNCTGQGRSVVGRQHPPITPTPVLAATTAFAAPTLRHQARTGHYTGQDGFTIPARWARQESNAVDFVQWYMDFIGETMPASTLSEWQILAEVIPHAVQDRRLTIHVLAEDSARLARMENVINVHARGLDAHAPSLYEMHQVTGIDFAVQAVLVRQALTPELIYEACRTVERGNCSSFAFVCAHATHRSCGCAVLLAILVYHDARIIFSTRRTVRAAVERGMTRAA
jgi:hypothetical protein